MSDLSDKLYRKYNEILFPYAYNILGSGEEAKDAVQDVMVNYFSGEDKAVADEKNYLIRAVVNTSINMRNRQKKMLRPGEQWLPEPIATDDAADRDLYLGDILSYSLLVLMEKLDARERAVFILKETFDYSHTDIASILDITEEHSRKLLSRAKAHLFKPASKRTAKQNSHERDVLARLMSAIRGRDMQQVEGTMAADIQFYADGGGTAPLLATQKSGAAEVAALLITAYDRFLSSANLGYTLINHQPALLSYKEGRLIACQVFDIHSASSAILQIHAVLDPDKLKALQQQALQTTDWL